MSDKPKPSNIVLLPGRTGKPLTPAAVQSSTHWLTAWNPAEKLPEGVAQSLPALVLGAEAAIMPADVQAFAIAMDELVQWVEQFGVIALRPDDAANRDARKDQIAGIVRGYRPLLADLPADLLLSAIRTTIGTHRFRNLPLPGEVRAHAEAELAERKTRLLRLKTAAMIAEREAKARTEHAEPRNRTPEQIAAAAAMVSAVRAVPVAPHTAPAAPGDLKADPVAGTREAVRRVAEETKGFRRIPNPWQCATAANASTDGGTNG